MKIVFVAGPFRGNGSVEAKRERGKGLRQRENIFISLLMLKYHSIHLT